MAKIRILVASRSGTVADAVRTRLAAHGRYAIETRVSTNGQADPLRDVVKRPDLMLLHHTPGTGELEYLAEQAVARRVPMIVFGPADDPSAMRLAMRAGASDYLIEPLSENDLLASIERIVSDLDKNKERAGSLISVVNGKGGSGATFLASNLACGLVGRRQRSVALADFDIQFGGMTRYVDVRPERGLLEALAEIEDMDELSAEAYLTLHDSGLKILAAPSEQLTLTKDITSEHVDALLHLLTLNNDYVVADLPRRIDNVSATVLERSSHVVLLVQQSLAHIHDTSQMINLITTELSIERDRIMVVVNRVLKNAIIEVEDIRKTLKVDKIWQIPNNYRAVTESIDVGTPLMLSEPNSTVCKAIKEIERVITGESDSTAEKGFLRRAIPGLLRSN